MTADRPTTEPRTEAGRDLLRRCESGWKTWMDEPIRVNGMRRMILAIEAEAAEGAAPRAEGPNPIAAKLHRRIDNWPVSADQKRDEHADLDAALDWERRAAPRAEGLVSIRDALDYFLPFIGRDFAAKEAQERIDQRVKAAQALAPLAAPRAEGLTCGVCEKPITGEAVCMDCFDRNVDGG